MVTHNQAQTLIVPDPINALCFWPTKFPNEMTYVDFETWKNYFVDANYNDLTDYKMFADSDSYNDVFSLNKYEDFGEFESTPFGGSNTISYYEIWNRDEGDRNKNIDRKLKAIWKLGIYNTKMLDNGKNNAFFFYDRESCPALYPCGASATNYNRNNLHTFLSSGLFEKTGNKYKYHSNVDGPLIIVGSSGAPVVLTIKGYFCKITGPETLDLGTFQWGSPDPGKMQHEVNGINYTGLEILKIIKKDEKGKDVITYSYPQDDKGNEIYKIKNGLFYESNYPFCEFVKRGDQNKDGLSSMFDAIADWGHMYDLKEGGSLNNKKLEETLNDNKEKSNLFVEALDKKRKSKIKKIKNDPEEIMGLDSEKEIIEYVNNYYS